jgi:diguanylate cyclase (GGDEF)-like protein
MDDLTLALLRAAVLAVFTALAVSLLARWRRGDGGAAAAWLSASFAVLALVTIAGIVDADGLGRARGTWPWKATVAVILLFPYCLTEFTASFRPTQRRILTACRTVTGLLVAWTMFLPPVQPGTRAAVFGAYAAAVVIQWTAFSLLAGGWLWSSARHEPAIARRRMRTLGAGSLFLNATLVTRVLSVSAAPRGTQFAVQIMILASGWLFFVGFTPPRPLRAWWRHRELSGFHRAQAELIAALDPESVGRVIVAQAVQLLGTRAAFITAADGRVLATEGIDADEAATVAAGFPSAGRSGTPQIESHSGVMRIPLRGGWLAVQASPATPFFELDENELLRSLCDSAGLALERAELFERDLMNRQALEASALQQAALAQFGQRALRGFDMMALFQDAVAVVAEVLGVDDVEIVEASTAGGELTVRATVDDPETGSEHDFLTSVGNILTAAVQRSRTEAALAHQALHDPLTSLPNRVLLLDRLAQAAARAGREPAPLALLFLDLDRFKDVNDQFGHRAGDDLLKAVATRLMAVVRPGDTVARFGGDEFVVLCENMPGQDQAVDLAERITDILGRPVTLSGREMSITASVGIVLADAGLVPADELLRDADLAMYQAKQQGGCRFAVFDALAASR